MNGIHAKVVAIVAKMKRSDFVNRMLRLGIVTQLRMAGLKNKSRRSFVPFKDADVINEVRTSFKEAGIPVKELKINLEDYHKWIEKANYPPQCYKDADYGRHVFSQKSLEHYIACKMLDIKKGDVYIDIAAALSPLTDMLPRLYGCQAYRQDLIYPPGINGNVIGGDAAALPVPDEFIDHMAMHCSFEHFENGSDFEFIKEANRVLKPGGKLCIVPLYMYTEYAIQTDMKEWPWLDRPHFERDAVLFLADGFANRYGRFYDVKHFVKRIGKNLDKLKLSIYIITNEKEVHPTVSTKFVALFEKAV
jgi:SAM-dependent methyltransferase